jgi:RNA polymerase sigma-70 factor (ECF subfamily)
MNYNQTYHQTTQNMQAELLQIEKAKANPMEFGPIYTRYYDQIHRYINLRIKDEEISFDVTAQVFIKAMNNIAKFEFRGVPFASWLYRIAKSELYQSFRDKKAEKTVDLDTSLLGDLMEEVEDDEKESTRTKLFSTLNLLNQKDLQMIEMRFFEKRPFKEIGDMMGITENNAKVRTFRALDRLRKLFKTNNC